MLMPRVPIPPLRHPLALAIALGQGEGRGR